MNLKEFEKCALEKVSVGNPEVNTYVGSCVSLIQQYLYNVFNISYKPRGNAKDWEYVELPGFKKVSKNKTLKKGDILVYGKEYGGGYGHLALIDSNMNFYDQNGIRKLKVGYQKNPFSGYKCILRANDRSKLEDEIIKKDLKNIDEIVNEVIQGKWGNGKERFGRLANAGYNANKIQQEVNNKLNGKIKSNSEIANEVIKGFWGNGKERIDRLTNAGYDSIKVQQEVNRMLR